MPNKQQGSLMLNLERDKMSRLFASYIKQALKVAVAMDGVSKFATFAELIGYTPDQLSKKLNGLNNLSYEDFVMMAQGLKEIDNRAYLFLVTTIFNDVDLTLTAA